MIGLLRGHSVLFEFETWNECGFGILTLYGCVLKAPIGELNIGDRIPIVWIDFTSGGTLQVRDEGGMILSEYEYSCIFYDLESKRIITSGELKEVIMVSSDVDSS